MPVPHRRIKSYVLRQGRLTKAQQIALDTLWQDFGLDHTQTRLDLAEIFGNSAPVTLEIGFGNGDSLIEQARQHPDKNYIGIEVHRPGVGHCLHLIDRYALSNLRVMNHDAIDVLHHQIPGQSLSCVQLFFPDPWHKKRHNKRRILRPDFIDSIHSKLAADGTFHMATDWQDYAEHMQQEMDASDLFRLLTTERGDRPATKFEKRGLKLGHGVWDFVYQKV